LLEREIDASLALFKGRVFRGRVFRDRVFGDRVFGGVLEHHNNTTQTTHPSGSISIKATSSLKNQ